MKIVTFSPRPPKAVLGALTDLRDLATPVPGESRDDARNREAALADLPRPWLPGGCDPALRARLYRWLDDVADWLNDQYSWQPKTMIPACWPRHPHIAHELAVLAMQRHEAELEIGPKALDEWHRYSRPLFVERMLGQLGEGCRTEHITWPGRSRHTEFRTTRDMRLLLFDADSVADN